FESSDLKINDQLIRFLNCHIKIANQLKFNIQTSDLSQFKNINPNLAKKDTNLYFPANNLYSNKNQAFSIDFTAKFKEPVFLSLN
ncbi:MAG: hypothetical protein Q8T04_15955, partial [Bacteroidota bacterium]|nr:hypothetical protein [Bacteroidota bacterium]